uniref:WD40 repeat domain 95 n=1 Tax=Oryzias latipes TaxID=8090 RepID=A0A3P9I618_ORYLA
GDFCTHMVHEYQEKQETLRRSKQMAFALPAKVKTLSHDFPIVNIHSTHDGNMFTVREDGLVCHWSAKLQPQRTKQIFWASDFTLMEEYNKLIIGTSREIQFYELPTLKPCCQISALDSIPLTVDCSTGPDKCCVLYGDTEGCVNIFLISSVSWNVLPKMENVPTITVSSAVLSPDVTFIRWKAHSGWVTKQLKEIQEAHDLGRSRKVKTSAPPQAPAPCDQTIFTICKGVKAFDLCLKPKMLVTGGMDRLIRLWHPHFPKPTGILKGHSAPIFFLWISSEDSQIVSVSVDCTVKIWHIQDECCLFTGESKASSIYGEISACHYSPAMKSLYIAADSIAVLKLKPPQPCRRLTESHNEPVLCCCYSEEFRQVLSCGEGSLITGRRDGSLKILNFNSGQCLKTLKKGKNRAVCDCILVKVDTDYVVSVGRDRRIDIYPQDFPEDSRYVQKPRPSWQDINGHKDDILCVAHCPPSFLATSSCDAEIIVWNAVSRYILNEYVNLWNVLSGGKQQKIIKLAKSDENMLLYAADRIGYVFVFSMSKFDLDQNSPREMFWRAHTSKITLQIVDSDQVVLTSSTDHTVRLWSAYGEYITFGQPEIWNIHVSSSWMHPADPYQVLIDPLSMPNHGTLN